MKPDQKPAMTTRLTVADVDYAHGQVNPETPEKWSQQIADALNARLALPQQDAGTLLEPIEGITDEDMHAIEEIVAERHAAQPSPTQVRGEGMPCGHDKQHWHNFGESTHLPTGTKLPETWACTLCTIERLAQPLPASQDEVRRLAAHELYSLAAATEAAIARRIGAPADIWRIESVKEIQQALERALAAREVGSQVQPHGIRTLSHAAVCKLSRIFNDRREQCSDGEWWEINGALKEEIAFSLERERERAATPNVSGSKT